MPVAVFRLTPWEIVSSAMTRNTPPRARAARRRNREAILAADGLLGIEASAQERETGIDPAGERKDAVSHRAIPRSRSTRMGIAVLPAMPESAGHGHARRRVPDLTKPRIIQPRAPLAVRNALKAAPVSLGQAAIRRVYRQDNEADMLLALDREITARLAPRGSREMTRLRRHVAELEAENERLRRVLRDAGMDHTVLAPVLMR